MDGKAKAKQQRNWFEKLLHKIPGFKGYHEREFRRDADRLQREFIVSRLLEVKNCLQREITDFSRGKDLALLTVYDQFLKRLESTANEIRYADQGYSGFFDLVKIKEAELDAIYELDGEMVDLAGRFSLEAKKPGMLTAQAALEMLEEYLDKLNAGFAQRTAILKGFQP